MLTPEQLKTLPRTTRNNWRNFSHKDYDGYEIAKDYIADFDEIKDVLTNKHLKQGMKMMCSLSAGYRGILDKVQGSKKLLREHSKDIIFSIESLAIQGNLQVSESCRLLGVSRDWFYRQRNKKLCSKSLIEKCFRQFPNQLTMEEVGSIEEVVSEPSNFGKTKTSLYYDSIRKGIIACGLSTFYKYADLLGYEKWRKPKAKRRDVGLRATRPFEWLHVDVTHVRTEKDGMQYVAFVKDNYSKAILGFKTISERPGSGFIRDLFDETFKKYKLFDIADPINILSDGGSENKGEFIEWVGRIKAPPVVRKLTAKTDECHFSNNMSESTHSIYKSEFLRGRFSLNTKRHLRDLEIFVSYYNENRFPFEFYGLTPYEVLNGQKPNKGKFREEIQHAQKKRIEVNRKFNACPLVCAY